MPAQVVNGVVSAIYSPSYSPDFVAPCLETMDTFPKFSDFYADSHWDVLRDSFTNWVPETSVNGNLPVLARIVSNVVIDLNPSPPPVNGVEFANVLATDFMIPLYKKKVIVFNIGSETKILALTQEKVDEAIEYMEIFRDYASLGTMPYNVSQIKYDDQSPIVLGEDTISNSEVPGDLYFYITQEPQFIRA